MGPKRGERHGGRVQAGCVKSSIVFDDMTQFVLIVDYCRWSVGPVVKPRELHHHPHREIVKVRSKTGFEALSHRVHRYF